MQNTASHGTHVPTPLIPPLIIAITETVLPNFQLVKLALLQALK